MAQFQILGRDLWKTSLQHFIENVLKRLFSFGTIDARFEPTLTKKSLNILAMQFLFVITFPFTINEFGVVLSFDFNVTIDLMPAQVF